MVNPINKSGQDYEAILKPAFERAGIHAIPQQRLPVIGSLLPGKKYIMVDYYVTPGQLKDYSNIAISVKGLTTQGSEQDKLLSHVDRYIPSHPCPVILIMLGDGWTPEYIQFAKDNVDGRQFLAVFTSSDELFLWLKRAKDGDFPKIKVPTNNKQLTLFEL